MKTQACEASPTCVHVICDCGKLIRYSGQFEKDHPGTVIGRIKIRTCGMCVRRSQRMTSPQEYHRVKAFRLDAKQAKLKSFGTHDPVASHFVPLGDDIISGMKASDGGLGGYIERRRRRGVPPEGWQYYLAADEAVATFADQR